MTKVKITSGNLFNIGDAIRDTNGTRTTYKPNEMAGAVTNLNDDILNGTIERYYANTGTISPNSFVEFVDNNIPRRKADLYEYTRAKSYAVALSSDKIFLLTGDYPEGQLYASIVSIDNSNVIESDAIQISEKSRSVEGVSLIALSSTSVFILYQDNGLYGMVCTINGTTITKGTKTLIVSNASNQIAIDFALNEIFITYYNSSNVKARICTIDGTSISIGSEYIIYNGNKTFSSAVKVSSNKVMLLCADSSQSNILKSIICNINGTTITAGSIISLDETSSSGNFMAPKAAVNLSDNKVFLVHCDSSSTLYGMICTIDGFNAIVEANVQLNSNNYSGQYATVDKIDADKVIISFSSGSSYYNNRLVVCETSGSTITKGTEMTAASNSYSFLYGNGYPVVLESNKIFLRYLSSSSGEEVMGKVFNISGTAITGDVSGYIGVSSKFRGMREYSTYLSSDKIFCLYRKKRKLYAVVGTISDEVGMQYHISWGNDILILNSDMCHTARVQALSSNKVFITYASDTTNYYLYGLICTIDGTSITKGTATQIASSGNESSIGVLSSDKVIVAHSYKTGNSNYLYGVVCDINDTVITPGTDKSIATGNMNVNYTGLSITAVSSNKAFVVYNYYNSSYSYYDYLSGASITIDGTNFTSNGGTIIRTNYSGTYVWVTKLSSDKVFVAHSSGSTYYLYGLVITLNSDNSYTTGTNTALFSTNSSGRYANATALSSNKVLISYYGGSGYLYGVICDINGTTITKGNSSNILWYYYYASGYMCPIKINSNKVLIISCNIASATGGTWVDYERNVYYAMAYIPEKVAQLSSTKIDGLVQKNLRSDSDTGDVNKVWILNN